MTRRSLFKMLFGCAAAPVAARAVPKVSNAELKRIMSWDTAMATRALREDSRRIAKIIADSIRKDYKAHYIG